MKRIMVDGEMLPLIEALGECLIAIGLAFFLLGFAICVISLMSKW